MANIGTFKRFVAIGCSHGYLADPRALAKILQFCKSYKPHRRIHLGDFTDQTAFRGGAHGTKDETVSIFDDIHHGLTFLREFKATDILFGNHEDRLVKFADHPNQVIARAAGTVITEIREASAKMGAKLREGYDINQEQLKLGDHTLAHGWMYGENALRDHALHFGNVIIAHLHIAEDLTVKRSDHPRGICCGTAADVQRMGYAKGRRNTSRWGAGLVYGEYNDRECHPNLSYAPFGNPGAWRLP